MEGEKERSNRTGEVEELNKYFPDAFGFLEVDAPNISRPILQTKVQTPGGVRTIAPIGA